MRWERLLVALVLVGLLLMGLSLAPAFAAEGPGDPVPTTDEPDPWGGDITPDPPPTDEPISLPPEPPDYSEPPDTSSDVSDTSEPGEDDPSSENPDDSSHEPSSEEPIYEPVTPVRTPAPTHRAGGTSSKTQLSRPKLTLNSASSSSSSSQPEAASLEPNYITFARLNQRTNSMSITLFYGGAGCILFGVLGLILLLALFIHNRHMDDRDGIFEEIAEAEQRQPEAYPAHVPVPAPVAQGNPNPQRQNPYPPDPVQQNPSWPDSPEADWYDGYDAAPAQDNLYTEEFEIPQKQQPVSYEGYEAPVQDSLYTEEFEIPSRQVPVSYGGYEAPVQDSLYTEEFDIPAGQAPVSYGGYEPPAQDSLYTEEFEVPVKRAPAPRDIYEAPAQDSLYTEEFDLPQQQQPRRRTPHARTTPPPAHNSYDTDEILRELLGKDKK